MLQNYLLMVRHEAMTDEEIYQKLKEEQTYEGVMKAEEWKKRRMKELRKEGRNWSR